MIEALADAEGVDPEALDYVLYDSVPPDALARLVTDGGSDLIVQFDVEGHTVIVDGDGTITVDGTQYDWTA